jgi:2-hydroxy-6-oxonona-2,4-dienedioate hydrolase
VEGQVGLKTARAGGLGYFHLAGDRAGAAFGPSPPSPRSPPYQRTSPAEPPVVLLHGLGMSSRYFLPLACRLAPRLAVFAPDLPGFGRSDKPERALNVEQLGAAAASWIEALGIAPAVLAGHSLGCQVAIEVALRRPELVDRLVLLAPTTDRVKRAVLAECLRLLRDLPREPPALVALALRDYLRAGPWRTLRTLRYALADRPEDKLSRIACPALVLRGERDPVVTRAWAEEVARLLQSARFAEVVGAAHALHFGAPRPVAARILDFLAG